MSTTDTQQTRLPWAIPIVGVVALTLAGGCSVGGPSAQAPASARPAPAASSPTTTASSPTTRPSVPEATRSVTAAPGGTLPPVPRGAVASFGTGVSARVTAVEAITAVATAPGDIAGPAFAISLSLGNGSTEAVDADNISVTAIDAKGIPASPVTGDQVHPFSGSISPGATQGATYPFRIPADAATGALIVVSYRAGVPIATLTI